jgi:hypothetical protein
MLLATTAWIASYFLVPGSQRQTFKRTPVRVWRDLLILGLSNLWLIVISIFFIVMWRYFFPLVPVFLVFASYIVHRVLNLVIKSEAVCK